MVFVFHRPAYFGEKSKIFFNGADEKELTWGMVWEHIM